MVDGRITRVWAWKTPSSGCASSGAAAGPDASRKLNWTAADGPSAMDRAVSVRDTGVIFRYVDLAHDDSSAVVQTQGVPAGIGDPASVDRKSYAVDETASGGIGQEHDRGGHVDRSGETSQWHTIGDVPIGV